MNNVIIQLEIALTMVHENLHIVFLILAILWGVHFINWAVGFRLNILGIYPRAIPGLVGIVFSPFLHGNFNHIFFNSIPLFILTSFMLLEGWYNFICASIWVIATSGMGVWLFGRQAIHVGASGVVTGYWGYLLANAYHQPTITTIILATVSIYYFGGIFLGIFPTQERSSWEGHLFGFIGGLGAAFLC